MRYLARTDDDPTAVLRSAISAFAQHLAGHGEARLASVVAGTLAGEADRLAQRFLALFTHGMGGLLDVPLYAEGQVDRDATDERDRLADAAYRKARTVLGDGDLG